MSVERAIAESPKQDANIGRELLWNHTRQNAFGGNYPQKCFHKHLQKLIRLITYAPEHADVRSLASARNLLITEAGEPEQAPVLMQSAAVPVTCGDAMLVPEIVL